MLVQFCNRLNAEASVPLSSTCKDQSVVTKKRIKDGFRLTNISTKENGEDIHVFPAYL